VKNCAIRRGPYTLVSEVPRGPKNAGKPPVWQLFNLTKDPGQQQDLASDQPEVVEALRSEYDAWWTSVRPQMVNEDAELPAMNPFKEMYWQQFGGGPSEEELRQMNPERVKEFGQPRPPAKAKGKAGAGVKAP
jgi:arylsulfatase